MTRKFLQLCLFATLVVCSAMPAYARPPRVLKFNGVPMAQGLALKKKYPFVFEREVTLAEVDDVTRFLMSTGVFSNVEVVEKNSDTGPGRELVLMASVLRKVQDVIIKGN